MTDSTAQFTTALLMALEETFEQVRGMYLDKGTSIFETLATISAEDASIPVSENCASVAAHVAHMTLYMETLLKLIGGEQPQVDWAEIWLTVGAVSAEEWQASQQNLRDAYTQLRDVAQNTVWDERSMGGAMAVLMHNAYHLGEIRQALCTIRKNADTTSN